MATIRHGETDYNRENRYAGSIDVPLSDTGKKDARGASAVIQSMDFDVTLVSPLLRALETARILTEGRMDIITCPLARERNYGVLEGLTSADVERIRPPIHFIRAGSDYHSLDIPQAETFEELRERAEAFFEYIIEDFTGQKVLLVSHGTFLQQLHGLLRGQDWIEALGRHVGNLELTRFDMDEKTVMSEDHIPLVGRRQVEF